MVATGLSSSGMIYDIRKNYKNDTYEVSQSNLDNQRSYHVLLITRDYDEAVREFRRLMAGKKKRRSWKDWFMDMWP